MPPAHFVLVITYLFTVYYFLVGLGFELGALALAKQALYCLSHTSSPLCFEDGNLINYLP
jgi:hypothetical protein